MKNEVDLSKVKVKNKGKGKVQGHGKGKVHPRTGHEVSEGE